MYTHIPCDYGAAAAVDAGGFETPDLNDTLYLHFAGYSHIENLQPYTRLRALYLESNALVEISGISHLAELRCLYLQNNFITRIGDSLAGLGCLMTLNISGNALSELDGLVSLPKLTTLNVSKNALREPRAIEHLVGCLALTSVDLSDNELHHGSNSEGDPTTVFATLSRIPRLSAAYLRGNPLVLATKHYRKAAILAIPGLRYLDESPVDARERSAANAWKVGGVTAAAAARQSAAAAERAADAKCIATFRAWRERKRFAPSAVESEARTFVSYGHTTEIAQSEASRLRTLLDRAEIAANADALHGVGLMNLGSGYWDAEAAARLDAATKSCAVSRGGVVRRTNTSGSLLSRESTTSSAPCQSSAAGDADSDDDDAFTHRGESYARRDTDAILQWSEKESVETAAVFNDAATAALRRASSYVDANGKRIREIDGKDVFNNESSDSEGGIHGISRDVSRDVPFSASAQCTGRSVEGGAHVQHPSSKTRLASAAASTVSLHGVNFATKATSEAKSEGVSNITVDSESFATGVDLYFTSGQRDRVVPWTRQRDSSGTDYDRANFCNIDRWRTSDDLLYYVEPPLPCNLPSLSTSNTDSEAIDSDDSATASYWKTPVAEQV